MYTLQTFYKSQKWSKILKRLKAERVNEQGLVICEYCGKPIVKAYDCIGHHKIELTEENVNDYDISLNEGNIQLIHHKCHNEIHERFGYNPVKKIYIVYGPPCAGKREYVEQIAGKDDLILDIDSIYTAISTNKRYTHSSKLSRNVFVIRDCMLDMIKTRTGRWNKAFVIGGYPYANERERLSEVLGAELLYIESTKEECLCKCKEESRGVEEFICKWFDAYTE